MSLCGSWAYTLSPKGRVPLPVALQEHLGPRVVLVIARSGNGPRLLVWSEAQWEQERAAEGHRREWWEIEAGTAVCRKLDAARRVQVPAHFRELFGWRSGEELLVRVLAEAVEVVALREWRAQLTGRVNERTGR